MGLFNTRNINKAKRLFEKNKGKIGSTVDKATDTIDKKTGGKYSDHLKKVDDAAKKLAGEQPGADGRGGLRPDESEGTASGLHPDPDAPKPNG
ncbi:MAG: hypothetical protein CL424_14830 [Acidimicrobiaceae bacterium]|nr:hypothetical protein [Acidimicrobiaceae bacterium]